MKFCMWVLGRLRKFFNMSVTSSEQLWRHRNIKIFIYRPILMKFCMCVLLRLKKIFDMSVTSSDHQNFYLPTDFDEILYACSRSTKKKFRHECDVIGASKSLFTDRFWWNFVCVFKVDWKKFSTWVWRHRSIKIFIYQPISMKFCMRVLGRLKKIFNMIVTSSEHKNFYLPTDFDEILYACTWMTWKKFKPKKFVFPSFFW